MDDDAQEELMLKEEALKRLQKLVKGAIIFEKVRIALANSKYKGGLKTGIVLRKPFLL